MKLEVFVSYKDSEPKRYCFNEIQYPFNSKEFLAGYVDFVVIESDLGTLRLFDIYEFIICPLSNLVFKTNNNYWVQSQENLNVECYSLDGKIRYSKIKKPNWIGDFKNDFDYINSNCNLIESILLLEEEYLKVCIFGTIKNNVQYQYNEFRLLRCKDLVWDEKWHIDEYLYLGER